MPRIVFRKDTGIFLNKKQEEKVLETFKWKEIYRDNLDSMFLQAYDCMIHYEVLINDYNTLSGEFDVVATKYKTLVDDCNKNLSLINDQKLAIEKDYLIEVSRKKSWRTIAITEGFIIGGIIGLGFLIF